LEAHSEATLLDYGELPILPGIIDLDAHLHLGYSISYDGGASFIVWEGATSGTMAAAAGGVTTLVNMPLLSNPVPLRAENVDQIVKDLKQKELFADIALTAYVSDTNLSEIKELLHHSKIWGLATSTMPPVDHRLKEISQLGLADLLSELRGSKKGLFLQAGRCQDRHIYFKSPFRKSAPSDRLTHAIPASINLLAGAFPEDITTSPTEDAKE